MIFMGLFSRSVAILALAGIGTGIAVDATKFDEQYRAEQRLILEDPFHMHMPNVSFPEAYWTKLRKLLDEEDVSLQERARARRDLLERIRAAKPEQAQQLESAVSEYRTLRFENMPRLPQERQRVREFWDTAIKEGVLALSRLGAVDSLGRLSDMSGSMAADYARTELEESNPVLRTGLERLRQNARRWETAEVSPRGYSHPIEGLIYRGTEEALQRIISRDSATAAAIFVNMYFDRPFVPQYRSQLVPLIEGKMKHDNGYFNCSPHKSDLLNLGYALHHLDPEYAGKLASIFEDDCDVALRFEWDKIAAVIGSLRGQ